MGDISITQNDVDLWRNNVVTQRLLQLLNAARKEDSEYLARGGSIKLNSENTTAATAMAVGKIAGYDFVLEADLVDQEVEDDGKYRIRKEI